MDIACGGNGLRCIALLDGRVEKDIGVRTLGRSIVRCWCIA